MSMDRVLVTRPEPAARITATKLKNLDFEPVLLPLFKTVFQQFAAQLIAKNYSALVFTSRNAVAAIEADSVGRSLEKDLPVYVVGKATAEAVRAAGFSDVRVGAGTGQQLAQLISRDQAGGRVQISVQFPILYLAGVERKPDFENALKKAGIAVRALEIYRMQKISYTTDFLKSDILSPFPKFVLLYSANAARRFADIFLTQANVLADVPVITVCLSQEVADALPRQLRANAEIAIAPNEADLLERLAAMR